MVYLVGNDWGGRNITTVFQETKKKTGFSWHGSARSMSLEG